MSIKESTDLGYPIRDTVLDLLMDTALAIIYGVVLINNFFKGGQR